MKLWQVAGLTSPVSQGQNKIDAAQLIYEELYIGNIVKKKDDMLHNL